LTLPKDHYYQGEVIKAALAFSNSSTAPYHLWIGTYDRSGRIPDIGFCAVDAAGQPVSDPLAWYFLMGGIGGGLGNSKDLGDWDITLPANQWLRFDKPGVYTIYAWSNRVQKGANEMGRSRTEPVTLVSDKTQITIEPLSPEKEKEIIETSRTAVAAGGDLAAPAVAQLRYLGTPASRTELLALLGDQRVAFDAMMGLCASPDPGQEAPKILAAVSEGKVPLPQAVDLYSRLKTHDLIASFDPTKMAPQDAQQWGQKLMTAMTQARNEITAAALKASGGKGEGYIEVLMTKFQQNNRDPTIRADLVQHQLELSDKQAEGLLSSWDYVGGEEFLPLARKMAAAPAYNMAALKALAKSKPDEAQALLVADAKLPKSNYFTHRYGSISMHRLQIMPTPIPELDAVLREKLASGVEVDVTLFYIDEYGTADLLPDVAQLYQKHEGKWACEVQKFALQYLMRCDPKGGAEALSRAVQSRASTGCYKNVIEKSSPSVGMKPRFLSWLRRWTIPMTRWRWARSRCSAFMPIPATSTRPWPR